MHNKGYTDPLTSPRQHTIGQNEYKLLQNEYKPVYDRPPTVEENADNIQLIKELVASGLDIFKHYKRL